jgi:predicted ArsR family transcriptional regulator
MAKTYAKRLEGLPLEDRLLQLVEMLSDEGFDAHLERKGDQVLIRELSCPYFRMGRSHPEVCVVDQTFIATALSVPVERISCLLDGDVHCTFSIPLGVTPQESPTHE